MSTNISVWIAAILTLAAFSFLYKENPVYRVTEYLLVGVGAAYALVQGWQNVLTRCIEPLAKGRIAVLFPAILGVLLFSKLSKKSAWLARYPMAALVSLGASVSLRAAVQTDVIKQIGATMIPLNSLDNVVMVFGTMSVLTYFFFTVGLKNSAQHWGARLGRWVMMVSFGAQLGSVAMLRTSLLIGRIDFLFRTWLGIVK